MATAAIERPADVETLADLLKRLGDIPLERIRLHPHPGTATEQDVIDALEATNKRLYELVDGVLVEKPMGYQESYLACLIVTFLNNFLAKHDLGIATGADGAMRLFPGLIRVPDVSFVSWKQLPKREVPDTPVPTLYPDLAVEVMSKSHTAKEIARKIEEYFKVGCQLVWVVYSKNQTAEVYTSPTKPTLVSKNQVLEGGYVLPGFRLPLKRLFARLGRGSKS